LLVFAAASLTEVLEDIGAEFETQTGSSVRFSFAASSALARQIEAGAQAGVFVSADLEWMDYLQSRGLLDAQTRRNIASNRLVLIAPAESNLQLAIRPGFPLKATLGRGRLATGDPDIVPVGRYARSALTTLGVWNNVADRLVRADNVRTALAYVASGEAPLGIVYDTDARVERRVRVVDVFPAATHAPIVYPAAAVARSSAVARQFLSFLAQADAQRIFREHGFQAAPTSAQ
jgi:molybdate transport system substrate-binding protein